MLTFVFIRSYFLVVHLTYMVRFQFQFRKGTKCVNECLNRTQCCVNTSVHYHTAQLESELDCVKSHNVHSSEANFVTFHLYYYRFRVNWM